MRCEKGSLHRLIDMVRTLGPTNKKSIDTVAPYYRLLGCELQHEHRGERHAGEDDAGYEENRLPRRPRRDDPAEDGSIDKQGARK